MKESTNITNQERTPINFDDVISVIRDFMQSRFPACEWASLVLHEPSKPDTVIVVSPRALASDGSPPEGPQSSFSAL